MSVPDMNMSVSDMRFTLCDGALPVKFLR
jgi:hypothetical protein